MDGNEIDIGQRFIAADVGAMLAPLQALETLQLDQVAPIRRVLYVLPCLRNLRALLVSVDLFFCRHNDPPVTTGE